MRRATLCTFGILVILILSMSPGSSAGRRRKILMAKKLAALLLLNKKRYIFVAPFPLPVPLPVITKVKHIIHKEKVPVPVPVPHHVTKYVAVPVPVPTKSWPEDSWKVPESVSASEMSYKISEKPHHHPKNLDKIFAESSHSLKYEKPTYSETPIKMSEKPTYLDGGSFKLNGKSYHFEENDKLPERLYSEEPIKFDMKPYSSSSDESYELPKKSQLDDSYKFNENAYSDELLSKLSGDLSGLNAGDSSEYFGESSELSESYPMLQEGSLMVKKKK